MKVYDLIIIGAGPAGMTASIYAKRANLDVLLMEKSAPGGQMISTAEIENYTGVGKVSGVDLAMKMFEHVQSLGVETMFEEVVKVHDLGSVKEVVTPSQTLQTKAVLITAGANPRTLGVKGEDDYAYRGISWCAICDGPLYKDKRVLVVGGGNSAVEESLFLSNIASHITIVQNLDRLTADPKAVSLLMKTPNVDIIFNAKVISFNGDDALKSVDVETKDGVKSIEVDGVFEYIGLTPVSDFVSHLGITNEAGYIVVNSNMETKVKGIFSAGDVNQKQIRQVVTATSDGAIAVQNIIKYLESLENSHLSFAKIVKEELAQLHLTKQEEMAELSALIQLNTELSIENHQRTLWFKSNNPTVARRFLSLLKALYPVDNTLMTKSRVILIKGIKFN